MDSEILNSRPWSSCHQTEIKRRKKKAEIFVPNWRPISFMIVDAKVGSKDPHYQPFIGAAQKERRKEVLSLPFFK